MVRLLLSMLLVVLVQVSLPGQEAGSQGRGVEVAGTSEPALLQGYADRHALVIGINEYRDPGFQNLNYAVADASAVANVLVTDLGFSPERVKVLLDGQATKSVIARYLEEWALELGPDDLLLVFYAGHGETQVGRLDKAGYLVPVDGQHTAEGRVAWSTLYGMSDLKNRSQFIPAKHALFIFDCCFGGLAVTRGGPDGPPGTRARARQVVSAGNETQRVADSGGRGHSVFTQVLLEAMQGQADLDDDLMVSFHELFQYVSGEVARRTGGQQTPLQGTFPDHEGGTVVLAAPDVLGQARPTLAERLRRLEEQLDTTESLYQTPVVEDLLREAESLYPAVPAMVPAFDDWLGRAAGMLSTSDEAARLLKGIRQRVYRQQAGDREIPTGDTGPVEWGKASLRDRYQYEQFVRLTDLLRDLDDRVAEVKRRRDDARTLRQVTLVENKARWDEAVNEIFFSSHYGEYEITPQEGLVPLGPDPRSGLWEFWHVASGTSPGQPGEYTIHGATGLVFVLIPGGRFRMGCEPPSSQRPLGSPNVDPYALPAQQPVHEVALEPFLLSKYEMSQGQWLRWTGRNPSEFAAGLEFGSHRITLAHPVEMLSWLDCQAAFQRDGPRGLEFPTEAQWEHAARAGTSTVWWTGNDMARVVEIANLGDQADWRRRRTGNRAPWDDGHAVHAPVDSFLPNPFGLHHTIGNVLERCQDFDLSYEQPVRPGDGERIVPPDRQPRLRINRGGSFMAPIHNVRSAYRAPVPEDRRSGNGGIRPRFVMEE